MKQIESEIAKLGRPISNDRYLAIKAISRKLNRLSSILLVASILIWLVLLIISPPWMLAKGPLCGMLFICSIIIALLPSMIGHLAETTKRPVVFSGSIVDSAKQDLTYYDEPNMDQIVRNYRNRNVHRKLSRKAMLVYWIGPLCAWDYDKLEPSIFSLLISLLYVLFNIAVPIEAIGQRILIRVFTAVSFSLVVYSGIEAFVGGGGKQKAIDRRRVLKSLKEGRAINHMIPLDELVERFSSGSYMKSAKEASVEDLLTKLYVKSTSKSRW